MERGWKKKDYDGTSSDNQNWRELAKNRRNTENRTTNGNKGPPRTPHKVFCKQLEVKSGFGHLSKGFRTGMTILKMCPFLGSGGYVFVPMINEVNQLRYTINPIF